MKVFRITAAVVLFLTLVLSVSGCSGKNFEPLELVPAGSDMIAGLKVSEGFRNWDIYNALEGDSDITEAIDEAKTEFVTTTGIDINDISEIVIFGKISDAVGDMETMAGLDTDALDAFDYGGFIFTGNFVDYDVVENISEQTGMHYTEEKNDDFSLYLADDGESAILPVNNTMFIMGTPDALKDCILVAAGEKEAVGGALLTTYTGLDDVMMKMAMLVPEEAKESFSAMPETGEMMPVGFKSFADMETMGFAAELGTMGLTVTASLGFPEPDLAADAAETMKTTIDFLMMMSTDEAVAEQVERLEITASSNMVFIDFTFTLAELAEMVETMKDYGSTDGFPMMPPMHSDDDPDIFEPEMSEESDD